ncbi:hypothetical protein V1227_33080 [Lentzea sp. DG1S-22]|uniref:hypothetical protein n=1 Tax=Lentzea sp. DG1S-22 TaxID=3108822 RepID=UPI002E791C82|nr:hypothetical protein [Lentzea sp. DG1S-22]WVH79815.1 hypothetical protein V1227_33080 [Lentzea sp. DG1S-22]
MVLSRLAREFAAEINYHDWSDAPYRLDRAGHQRDHDGPNATANQLSEEESNCVRTNVMWVVAQVLGHADPNFDVFEFAEWCGVNTKTPSGRPRSGHIPAGLRVNRETLTIDRPGDPETWDEETVPADLLPTDTRPQQVGTATQRARQWPADQNTRGFVTARSRNIHRTTDCVKYQHTVNVARQRGRKVHPVVWITTGEARAIEKGICSHCWS